ncbi:MAG TPA: sulfotransferase [Acidimicrobiia bacterium]|nr:sulfotransferase [Acidimicrobiia bacterium]
MGSPPPALDFVVIGAQKGGTTTLFEHLRQHPRLCLPADKEAPFFNRPELYSKGAEHLFTTYFPQPLPEGRLLGTVTPQYMCIRGCAQRVADAFPAARLVAILRDPVERAYSHYRMAARRDQDTRSFDDAIAEMLSSPEALEAGRASTRLGETYVAWSEYGRMLGDYLERFDREQLLVTYTSDLESEPAAVLGKIYEFLGVSVVLPDGLGERFHVGGSQRRFPNVQRRLRRSPVGWLWKRMPQGTRSRLFIRFDHWNVRRDEPAAEGDEGGRWSAETEARLRAHFAADEAALADRFALELPWA